MMKIAKRILFMLMVSILLAACSGNDAQSFDDITIQNFPSVYEISKMSHADRKAIKVHAKTLPLEDCEAYFSEVVDHLLRAEDSVTLDHLEITEDRFSLAEGRNKKPMRNLSCEIHLLFEQNLEPDFMEARQNIADHILSTLSDYSYFALNVRNAAVYNVSHNLTTEILGYAGTDAASIQYIEQPSDEYHVQTLLYDFKDQQPGFRLSKFGILPETQELLIEYCIDEFLSGKYDGSKDDLEQISKDIQSMLLADAESAAYLQSHKIQTVTVSFSSIYLDGLILDFQFYM